MRKKLTSFISLFLVLFILSPILAGASSDISIAAWAAIAIDADTGEILYSKNPDKQLVPASLTKIMTTYIIYEEIEAGNLTKDSMIGVSERVAKISRDRNYPMAVPLDSGPGYTVDEFIKLIMIPSASASCIAVAEHISGSEEEFVNRMNETARRMGIDADFKNSHGARPHYTTARSMAILVKNFIEDYPDILNYSSLDKMSFNGRDYKMLNKLITSKKYEGVDGFKTGTIKEARYCLASTGEKDGRRVIVVVLGSPSDSARYSDSKKILDLAFSKVSSQDSSRDKVDLSMSDLPGEIRRKLEYSPKINFKNVEGPFSQTGRFYVDGQLVKEFTNKMIGGEESLELPFVYDEDGMDKEFLELKYEMDYPKASPKTLVKKVRLSDKEPALYKDIGSLSPDSEIKLKKLRDEKLMEGTGDGYFKAYSLAKRADFITLLGRFIEEKELDIIEDKPSLYQDVETTDYYNKYIVWASEKGLVEGYRDEFQPNKNLNLEEMSKILYKFSQLYGLEFEEADKELRIDKEKLSPWAEPYLEKLLKTNIFYTGNSESIDPKSDIRRIDLVDLMWNIMESYDNLDKDGRK